MKIKFNTDDDLLLNESLKLRMLTIIVRSVFEEEGNFYLQGYLDGCLYELQKCCSTKKTDVLEGIDISKTSVSKKCMRCHYWYFKDVGFRF